MVTLNMKFVVWTLYVLAAGAFAGPLHWLLMLGL